MQMQQDLRLIQQHERQAQPEQGEHQWEWVRARLVEIIGIKLGAEARVA